MLKSILLKFIFRSILSLDIAISFTLALASKSMTLLRSFFWLLWRENPAWVQIKTKNQTLLLFQIRYHQHSSEVTMQNNFLNKSMFIMQSETKCNQEGAWLYFKRKCTQEWVWNQKQLWYLLDCHPQPLLPKHAEWKGLAPRVLGCRPNFLTQGRLTGPTTPVLSGQSWVALLSSWGQREGLTEDKAPWVTLQRGVLQEEGASQFYWLQPHPLLLPSSWLPPILLDLTPINLNFGPLPRFLKNLIWL